ncbi:MAG: AI-2E family transporter [Anaerolineales bacterium]|nr:AI-2E family transporter [Anaerolineales bacterium]
MSKSWSKTTRYFVLGIVIILLVWFLVAANGLIGPLAIAAMLAYVLNPMVSLVNSRTKLPRNWVVLLVYLTSLATIITLGIIFVPIIPSQTALFLEELQIIQSELEAALPSSVAIAGFRISLSGIFNGLPGVSTNFFRPDTDVILLALQAATTNLGWILVILVTTYYLLQDWPIFREWILGWAPDEYEYDARRLYYEVRNVWQRYLRGQLRLMFIVGILTGLGAAAIGLPGALAFGVLAGLFDVVLSVGPAIVMVVAALVALYSGSTFLAIHPVWFMALVLAVFGGIQGFENIWLRPRIMGQTLHIHPAVLFVAVIGSLALGGVLVALIIIPVLGSAGILGRYLYCKILDLEPWPDLIAVVDDGVDEVVIRGGETAVSSPPATALTVTGQPIQPKERIP